jgi:hypothetical protein
MCLISLHLHEFSLFLVAYESICVFVCICVYFFLISDEETGCCINGFRVSIRRRWNYENNVSAVVCYVSTGKNM